MWMCIYLFEPVLVEEMVNNFQNVYLFFPLFRACKYRQEFIVMDWTRPLFIHCVTLNIISMAQTFPSSCI
jgi:hypothetical protein